MSDPKGNTPQHDTDEIQILKPPHAVRFRPEMFVGKGDQEGIHGILFSCVDGMIKLQQVIGCPLYEIRVHIDHNGGVVVAGSGAHVSSTAFQRSIEFWKTYRYSYEYVISLCEHLYVAIGGPDHQWCSLAFEQGMLQSEEYHSIMPSEKCDIWIQIFPDLTIVNTNVFTCEQALKILQPCIQRNPDVSLIIDEAK